MMEEVIQRESRIYTHQEGLVPLAVIEERANYEKRQKTKKKKTGKKNNKNPRKV